MTEISFTLSEKSIGEAIKQVRKYRKQFLKKVKLLRQRVADELAKNAREGFNGAPGEDILFEGQKVPDIDVYAEDNGNLTFVVAQGPEAVFVEFGAGVYFNAGGGRPDRPQGIVGIGEYGKGYGKRRVWGFYDENGDLKLTHGTPSSMPLYYASKRIAKIVPQLAKEIFREG